MKGRRILVTGANGFLGKHVVALLTKRGYRVSTLGRRKSEHTFPHLTINLTKKVPFKTMGEFDAIVHLASEVNIAKSIETPDSVITENLAMTTCILNSYRTSRIKPLIVFLSTDRVYGKARGRVTETTPTFPIEPYTASKIMSEILLETYFNQFDIPYISLRASAFFGPHQPRRSFISDVIQKMIAEDKITVGPLTSVKNFTYVENVAYAVLAALRAPHSARNRTYNIGGKPVALSQVFTLCRKMVEKKLDKKISVRIDNSIRLPQKNEIGAFALSTLSAKKMLRWKERISLKDGIKKTVTYFLENK